MESLEVITEKHAASTMMYWHKLEMEWSIQCFQEIMEGNPKLYEKASTCITSELGHVWKLSVRAVAIRLNAQQSTNHYEFCLSCTPKSVGQFKTKCTIKFKALDTGALYSARAGTDRIEYFGKQSSSDPDHVACIWKVSSVDFERDFLKHGLTSHDGTLMTVWTVKILQFRSSPPTLNSNENLQSFSNQLQLDRDLFPDIKFITGSEVFNAHKVVLAARSSVFRAMFSSSMVETQTDKVDMSQHRANAVGIMLDYIYTGKYAQLYAKEVLQLADMYDIPGLKSAAETELIQNLQPECAAKYMHYGDLFQCPKLKEAAIAYIKRNKHLVMENESHKDYLDLHRNLLKEISDVIVLKSNSDD